MDNIMPFPKDIITLIYSFNPEHREQFEYVRRQMAELCLQLIHYRQYGSIGFSSQYWDKTSWAVYMLRKNRHKLEMSCKKTPMFLGVKYNTYSTSHVLYGGLMSYLNNLPHYNNTIINTINYTINN